MPKLIVTTREGETSEIDVADGLTVMEAIRDNGFDELLALCGGCCSCATCHVYLDEPEVAVPAEDQEKEVLEGLIHHRDNSRLLCQLEASQDITELKIQIAPAE